MISFLDTQGTVTIRLACSKALLLTISSVTNISFFIKVSAANGLLKLNYLQSRAKTQYRKIILITSSNIKHFIERSSVTY